MRRLAFIILFSLGLFSSKAQEIKYFSDSPSALIYSMPRTVIKVDITTEKHSVSTGVYARYAQKYLGVVAPLASKDSYRVVSAKMSYYTESDPSEIYTIDASEQVLASLIGQSGNIVMPFINKEPQESVDNVKSITTSSIDVAPDRVDMEFKSLEQRAEQAAGLIFNLRKRRMELITGDIGENVFGAGLGSALDEIARLEKEYLELFLGEQTYSTQSKQYELVPEKDKNTYVVARFSQTKGLCEATDLSAEPLVLELKTETLNVKLSQKRKEPVPSSKEQVVYEMFKYKVAPMVNCRLTMASELIIEDRMPVFQMGQVVDIPVNKKVISK